MIELVAKKRIRQCEISGKINVSVFFQIVWHSGHRIRMKDA
jgi:hypothetical protein